MPLTNAQIAALKLRAASRDPESYVAGSTPLGQTQIRYSRDIDIFHDREERVAQAAETDAATLAAHDYTIHWERRTPGVQTLVFLLRKKIEGGLQAKHPEHWLPLYSQVKFSDMEYRDAWAEGLRQDRIMEEVLALPDIEARWDSDEVERKALELAARLGAGPTRTGGDGAR